MANWNAAGRRRTTPRAMRRALDPGSIEVGMNLNRRSFVELALGSAAGATLVGAGLPVSAAAAPGAGVRVCDGEGIPARLYGGTAGEVIDPKDRAADRGRHEALPGSQQ